MIDQSKLKILPRADSPTQRAWPSIITYVRARIQQVPPSPNPFPYNYTLRFYPASIYHSVRDVHKFQNTQAQLVVQKELDKQHKILLVLLIS